MFKLVCSQFFVLFFLFFALACSSDDGNIIDGDFDILDGDSDSDTESELEVVDSDIEFADGDLDAESEMETEYEIESELEAEQEVLPLLPVAACNMEAYELLSREEVGDLLDYEAISFWDKSAVSLNSLLSSLGVNPLGDLPYGVKTYRYKYTTQDKGKSVEATSLLVLPVSDEKSFGKLPVMLYSHGTSGFSDPCAPSHGLNELEGPAGPALMAAMGYIVVAPDYIGMNGYGEGADLRHGYLVGEQTAIGSWDAVRAAEELLLAEGSYQTNNQVIPWGGSQGGHAVLFEELYAPYYAPEYEVPAVISLIVPSTLKPLLKAAVSDMTAGTGLVGISLVTMHIWYGELASLSEVVTNEDPYYLADNLPTMLFPQEKCDIEIDDGVDLDKITVEMLFNQNFMDKVKNEQWDQLDPWSCFYSENSLLTSSVKPLRYTPTLMVYAEDDELIDTKVMRDDFVALCDSGYQLEYLECAGAGHTQGAIWSLPEQFAWLNNILAGNEIASEKLCKVEAPTCCKGSPEDAECLSE